MPKATTVFVCRECKHARPLARAIGRHAEIDIREVGCQKVCEEPVCGVRAGGAITWFGGMDKPKRQKALIDLVVGGGSPVPKALEKARSKKQTKSPR